MRGGWLADGAVALAASCCVAIVAAGADRALPGRDARRDVRVAGVDAARAEAVAACVSETRRAVETLLLGTTALRPWVPPCTVHVHGDRSSFAAAVSGAPAMATGATSIEFVGDTVALRRIDVIDGTDGGVPSALAHEVVHVVLADHFTDNPPPRWADEGLATLFDDPVKQQGHEADFRHADAHGQAWNVADLMALELEPVDAARQRVFYGQSAALVRWLLARRDGPTFLRFIDQATREGPAAALRFHYGIASAAELERAWRADPAPPPGPAEPDPGERR